MSHEESSPIDSELVAERPRTQQRAAHRSPANIVLVAVGGTIGTGLRYGLTLVMPPVGGIPVAIFTVNIVGAFLLALLLETLSEFGPDHGWSRRLRLGLGTGVLGGFTTYSTLAADNVSLALASPMIALAYGVGTVVVGGIASAVGIAVARHALRPRIERTAA
ncbi:MAG: CrcB family protein [Microlunatus sp.]